MVRRREITDQAWEHIEPLLPQGGGGGVWDAPASVQSTSLPTKATVTRIVDGWMAA
jgi:hypothetical protein